MRRALLHSMKEANHHNKTEGWRPALTCQLFGSPSQPLACWASFHLPFIVNGDDHFAVMFETPLSFKWRGSFSGHSGHVLGPVQPTNHKSSIF